jgi:hypothetical protein
VVPGETLVLAAREGGIHGIILSRVERVMTDDITHHAKELGKRGGQKTRQLPHEHFVEIGKKGAAKRWGKLKPTQCTTNRD